jgi:hypothetical protein
MSTGGNPESAKSVLLPGHRQATNRENVERSEDKRDKSTKATGNELSARDVTPMRCEGYSGLAPRRYCKEALIRVQKANRVEGTIV